ncbi:MAG: hypothetical protein GC189_13830 [Alphaproteobacteria bacterium]|nr:hypothetical protein [Alphaproteobacteria bacterium]
MVEVSSALWRSKGAPLAVMTAIAAIAVASPADAYAGAGSGLAALGSLIALIGAGLLALFGFIWFPIKRLLRGKKPAAPAATTAASDANAPAATE